MPNIQVGLLGVGLAGSAFHAPLIQACLGLRLAAIGSRSFEGKQVPAGVRCAGIDEARTAGKNGVRFTYPPVFVDLAGRCAGRTLAKRWVLASTIARKSSRPKARCCCR
jgi:hypothetical protein